MVRFGKREKLSSRYIGPFEVLERVGTVSYQLALQPNLSGVHTVIPCLHAPKIHSKFDSCGGLRQAYC